MTAVVLDAPRTRGRGTAWTVVRALGRQEARRHLRSPVLPLGMVGSLLLGWSMVDDQKWAGIVYTDMPVMLMPLYLAVSVVVAASFRRERVDLAAEAPVGEVVRALGRLLGAALVPMAYVLVAALAVFVWIRLVGGVDLGYEPGRTLTAKHTLPEALQPVALGLVAVGAGAVLGRRTRRATGILVMVIGWYLLGGMSWAFQATVVRPFSVIQLQPYEVEIGPPTADPLSFPDHWLLQGPDQYVPFWRRLVVSPELAVGHDVWLVGLALLLVALALPRAARRRLVAVGAVLAAVGVVVQYVVAP